MDLQGLMDKLAEQEALVDALEQELTEVKVDREREEERRWKEVGLFPDLFLSVLIFVLWGHGPKILFN